MTQGNYFRLIIEIVTFLSFFVHCREWTNGVLTVAALEAVDEPSEVNTWIVCDGDIDPEWVESLNSVLGKVLELHWIMLYSSAHFFLF